MTTSEFESLKGKVTSLQAKQSKAIGAIESIEATWQTKYGVSTKKEVEALLKEKEADVAETDASIDKLFEELKGLTDWRMV